VEPSVDVAVVLPVKSFDAAKQRLAAVLDHDRRHRLARATARHAVITATDASASVYVVCDDPDVAAWATALGARTVTEPGIGLDAAVACGVDAARRDGHRFVVVAHGDLPRLPAPTVFVRPSTITLVPDRAGDGTNVIAFPADVPMRFAYGRASFRRHLAIALEFGRPVRVLHDADAEVDLDTAADLAHPRVAAVVASVLRSDHPRSDPGEPPAR
jgi:2-phospho-L-lactate guanylyltransferase